MLERSNLIMRLLRVSVILVAGLLLTGCASIVADKMVEPPKYVSEMLVEPMLSTLNDPVPYLVNHRFEEIPSLGTVTEMLPTRIQWQFTVDEVEQSISVTAGADPNVEHTSLPERRANGRGTVIVLHGHSMNRQLIFLWGAMMADAGFSVLSLDLPGHGDSPLPLTHFGLKASEQLNALRPLLSQQSLPPPYILVGVSLGATAAIRAAMDDPEWHAVIAFEPFDDLRGVLDAGVENTSAPIRWMMHRGTRDRVMQKIASRLDVDLSELQLRPTHEYPVPTLVLHSQYDDVVPLAQSQRIAAVSPAITLWQYRDGGGHETFPTPLWRHCRPVMGWLNTTLGEEASNLPACDRIEQAADTVHLDTTPLERIDH
ncbi:MAG: alpha/beta fold hydrolase [Pseudomonadota bacterium]